MDIEDAVRGATDSAAPPAQGQGAAERAAEQAVNDQVRADALARAVESRATPPADSRRHRSELTAGQVRAARAERAWRTFLHARRTALRGVDPLRAGFATMPGVWPTQGTHFRDPDGLVKDYVGAPSPPRVVYPFSDVASRTTYVADPHGRPQGIPAEALDQWLDLQHEQRLHEWLTARGIPDRSIAVRAARAIRTGQEAVVVQWLAERGIPPERYAGIRPWLDRDVVHLDAIALPDVPGTEVRGGTRHPFASPALRLPGEPKSGLQGRTLPYPTRGYGTRPQAHRLHTCIACSYAKFDRYERDYDLCKDCHRIVGSIPHGLFRQLRQGLEERGLIEAHARSLQSDPAFADVARELALRWRRENLQLGVSAGESFVVYPQSDLRTKRTLFAGADGRPRTVRAAEADDRALRPIRGRYPTNGWTDRVDLAAALGEGLARSEDELMLAGDRSARSEESLFESEADAGRETWAPGAAALSDFTGQREIVVQRGTGLSNDEIFRLSDQVDALGKATFTRGRETNLHRNREGRRGPRRFTRYPDAPRLSRTKRASLAPRGWRPRADMRHLRAHADPLFHAGPSGEVLTRHALAGALSAEQRDALRDAIRDRDWSEALHQDAAWDRRRERLGISPRWREHSDWSGPLRAVTPPVLTRAYSGATGVDEALGRHEYSEFLNAHATQLNAWLTTLHDQRVHEWLNSQGIGDRATARRVAAGLRTGEEPDVVSWLERRGVPYERYEAAREWIDEANPRSFESAHPVNPAPREIGDLTPETPVRDRLAAAAAEPRNWRAHGAAGTPAETGAAIRAFRSETAVAQAQLPPPTPGTVAVRRGNEEAPREFADARARLHHARESFNARLAGVFADPDAFRDLFATSDRGTQRQIIEGMRTSPATLEGRFGAAARLVETPVGGARGSDIVIAPGVSAASGAHSASAESRARAAALEGPRMLEARRDYRRALRTVFTLTVDEDALHHARTQFRAATVGLFADERAFHRAFARLSTPHKREVLTVLAERPDSVAEHLGRAGRLSRERTVDPRWAPLVTPPEQSIPDRAATAALAGRAYVAQLATAARRMRDTLLVARSQAREAVLAVVVKRFPEAPGIDTHARLSEEIDRVRTDITARRAQLAQLDRTHVGLLASAAEFRQQLTTIVSDPGTFIARFRALTTAEKHRVFDVMAQRPHDLATLPALGKSARLRDGATRFTALVAQHGRHYVETAVRYRGQIEDAARSLKLPETASRADVRTAILDALAPLEARSAAAVTARAELPQPDLTRAAAQWQALGDAERAHVALAFPHLVRTMDRVADAREVGASAIGRQRKTTALKEHSGKHRGRNKTPAGLEL